MSPSSLTADLIREVPLLSVRDPIEVALLALQESELPALPAVDDQEHLAGIFGEREFMGALFPGYLKELTYAGFVPSSLDDAIEKRAACRDEPVAKYMNDEHIDVGSDFSDAQVAETFLHHRVLVIPVADDGQVRGVITRGAFFRRLAERFLDTPGG
jgi:CBS domain-containing protein